MAALPALEGQAVAVRGPSRAELVVGGDRKPADLGEIGVGGVDVEAAGAVAAEGDASQEEGRGGMVVQISGPPASPDQDPHEQE